MAVSIKRIGGGARPILPKKEGRFGAVIKKADTDGIKQGGTAGHTRPCRLMAGRDFLSAK